MGGPKQLSKATKQKPQRWHEESQLLRRFLVGCDLDEEIKWGKSCYTFEGQNIAIVQKMKAFLALMYFKGALLEDDASVLKKPGENSHYGRRFEFTTLREIASSKELIERYTREAVENEKAGRRVPKPEKKLNLPEELLSRFRRAPDLKAAFEALTPGRQRGYSLYFSAPKGATARERRIDKYAQKILDGRGFHDR